MCKDKLSWLWPFHELMKSDLESVLSNLCSYAACSSSRRFYISDASPNMDISSTVQLRVKMESNAVEFTMGNIKQSYTHASSWQMCILFPSNLLIYMQNDLTFSDLYQLKCFPPSWKNLFFNHVLLMFEIPIKRTPILTWNLS